MVNAHIYRPNLSNTSEEARMSKTLLTTSMLIYIVHVLLRSTTSAIGRSASYDMQHLPAYFQYRIRKLMCLNRSFRLNSRHHLFFCDQMIDSLQ
jgi:hypothetical protein